MTEIKRSHSITIDAGGDTKADMIRAIKDALFHIERGDVDPLTCTRRGLSGSPSMGYSFRHTYDPSMTHERYHELIDAMGKDEPPAIVPHGSFA